MEILKNYMEDAVRMMMKDLLNDINVCQCEKCLLDIGAIALNSLPAKYIVTRKGELYSRIDALRQQFEVDIMSAIIKAAILVKKYPRH